MDGVLTVDELRASGMTRPVVDLLPRIDGLVGLRQTKKLDDSRLTRIHAALVAAPPGRSCPVGPPPYCTAYQATSSMAPPMALSPGPSSSSCRLMVAPTSATVSGSGGHHVGSRIWSDITASR